MRTYCLLSLLLIQIVCFSQETKQIRAFPITAYVVDLDDSLKIVQVHLEDSTLIKEKQVGIVRGSYRDSHGDTLIIGAGRCNLIKSVYYYFAINIKKSGIKPKENDLLYTNVTRTNAYDGRFLKLAAHFIELQNVYEAAIYDRYGIFNKWTAGDESRAMDSIVTDIRFTGDYFLKNSPTMNETIKNGKYKDRQVLNVMIGCNVADVMDFLDYMIARPRLYAGNRWKISEIFATWLTSGAPTVIR